LVSKDLRFAEMGVGHDQQFFFPPEKGTIGEKNHVLTVQRFLFGFMHKF